jgi:hypothetical protein
MHIGCMGLAPSEVDYADSVPPMPYGVCACVCVCVWVGGWVGGWVCLNVLGGTVGLLRWLIHTLDV